MLRIEKKLKRWLRNQQRSQPIIIIKTKKPKKRKIKKEKQKKYDKARSQRLYKF